MRSSFGRIRITEEVSLLMAAGLISLCSGCIPFIGHTMGYVPKRTLTVLDAGSKGEIRQVLILPRYLRVWGTQTVEDTSENGTFWYSLATPVEHKGSKPLELRQPMSLAINWLPFAFAASFFGATQLQGMFVLAPGYEVKYISFLDGKESACIRREINDSVIELSPRPSDPEKKVLLSCLKRKMITPADADRIETLKSNPHWWKNRDVRVQLTRKEEAVVRPYLLDNQPAATTTSQ